MRYMEGSRVQKKPPSTSRKAAPWRIALIANIKDEIDWGPDAPSDAGSEFDGKDTLEAIAAALEEDGHWVHICRGDDALPEVLQNLRPHICFNIAEGLGGDAREAQVPALCELLGIPYTASQVLANALSLDKTRTKRIWRDHGLPTAPFQEWRTPNENLDPALTFPLFVKPVREGTGMGVDTSAVVQDERSLRERVEWLVRAYRQPALVESFLPGREFTVGFIGNPGDSETRSRPWLYNERGYHFFPVLEIDNTVSISPGVYGHDAKGFDIGVEGAPGYLCPADIPNRLRLRLLDLASRASEALGVRDVSRIDFRTTAEGKPYLMEINTLPGLNPKVSDLCIMAASEGMAYPVLITEILYLAAERYGLSFEPRLREQIISASALGSMATSDASWGYASRGQGS
jgi:D-alanine-D-alanine ligase